MPSGAFQLLIGWATVIYGIKVVVKYVLGIDQGISLLMAENLRTGFVWNTFMRNRESVSAMQRAGFHETISAKIIRTGPESGL